MRFLVLVPVLFAACGASPATPEEKPREATILDFGTTWVYADPNGKEYTCRIEGPMAVEGMPCVAVRGANVGISLMRWHSADVTYWSLSESGEVQVHAVGEGESRLIARSPVAAYKKGAERGHSWEARFYAIDPKTGVEDTASCKFICGGRKTIGLPVGEFQTYYVVEEWRFAGQVQVRVENWWEEKLGIIQQVYHRVDADGHDRETLHLVLKTKLVVKNIPRKNP